MVFVQKYEEGMQGKFMNCHFQQGDDEKEKILRNDVGGGETEEGSL